MNIEGPLTGVEDQCEAVLRTLPRWFGIEESLLEYASGTAHLPTFVVQQSHRIVGFLSLREHFPGAWELICIAIESGFRGQGLGRRLHEHAEQWLRHQGATVLQVKTLAASHPSKAYAETREFYRSLHYKPIEIHPTLWAAHLPVLQLMKILPGAAQPIAER